jgi:serine/threonine-protein kinase
MGSVHVAFDTVLLRKVAQKFLDQNQETDPSIVQQFVEEARITGQLDHPNVVPVHELAVDQSGQLFFTMKHIDGETYGDKIRRFHQSPNDPEELYRLLQVFLKICDAVGFAHERGVVHCDIKPDNVMVGSFGQVYVMDWGVALLRHSAHPDSVQLGSSARNTQYVGGTLSYMAPEQAWGRPEDISALTDIYGLGGLLHYLLTAKPPNYDTTRLDGVGNPRNIARETTLPLVPPGLCQIAERALSPRPTKRYSTADEMKRAVEAFIAGGGWFAVATFETATTIIHQGEPGDSAFVITEGYCDCWTEGEDGDPASRTFIRTMGPGEVFGEMAVLTGRPRSATVTAKTAVKVRIVNQASLEQELRRNPLLGSFVRTIVDRFAERSPSK